MATVEQIARVLDEHHMNIWEPLRDDGMALCLCGVWFSKLAAHLADVIEAHYAARVAVTIQTRDNPTAWALGQQSLRECLPALHVRLAETEVYLIGYRPTAMPTPEDLCCESHRARWQMRQDSGAELVERRKRVEQAIAEVSDLIENGEPDE